jgi:hypothetical protein
MGASNDERANAVADWFARAGSQIGRMNETVAASKADVKRTALQKRTGAANLRSAAKLEKAGIKYAGGKGAPPLTTADTLHLINGKVVKGTANAGGIIADSTGAPVNNPGGDQSLSKNDFLDSTVENLRKNQLGFLGGGKGGLGDFIADTVKNVSKNTPVGDVQNYLLNNSDPLGRPQNAGQWVMNALSAPLYAVAEGSHAVGEAAAQNEAKGQKHDLNPFAPAGAIGSIGTFLGGASRGAAEGFGARFADHQPRTMGSNLEELGTQKALQGALGKDAGNFAQGVLGGAADIAFDPTTWFSIGAGAAAKGAIAGARDARVAAQLAKDAEAVGATAVRDEAGKALDASVLAEKYSGKPADAKNVAAAERALPKAPAAGQRYGTPLQEAVIGAGRGFRENVGRPVFGDPVKAQFKQDTRAIRKAYESLTPAERATVQKLPKEQWAQGVLDAAAQKQATGQAFAEGDLADTLKPIPKGLQGVLNPQAADAMAAGVNDLLPTITSRAGDAESLLARSTTGGEGAALSDTDHAAVQSAISASINPRAWQANESLLRRNPQIASFFDSTMKVGGREYKVAEVARKLATGDPLSTPYRRYQEAFDGAITQAKGRAGTVAQPDLAGALQADGFAPDLASGNLVERLNSVPFEARKNLLQQIVGGGKTYKTFDDAMRAASQGQIESTMMRTMLARLGIESKAAKPQELQRLLDGQGKTNWEQIKASVRSPQEVLDIHGIDDTAVAAAERMDLGAELPAQQEAYQASVQAQYGYDPMKIAPLKTNGKVTGDSTGAAIFEASQTLGNRLGKGESTEGYDIESTVAVHKAMMRELGQTANMRGLSGQARAAYILPRYREAMRTVEAGSTANGIMPRIVDEHSTVDPLFVSWGQIIDEIPDETLGRALFSPDFSRGTHAAELEKGFKQGFTAYPSAIMNGVRAAMLGHDADTVAGAMFAQHIGRSDTDKYINLRGIYQDVAQVITSPEFVAKMKALDAAQQPLAYAYSRAAAEGIVTPISQRIMTIVDRAGDQGATRDEIRAALADARREATSAAGYPSLVADMTQQRLDNGFVNGVLGEYGALVLNAQERMVKANRVASLAGAGRKLEQNKARVAQLDDAEPHMKDSAGVGAGADEVEELANNETYWNLMDAWTGIYRWTQRMGTAFSGRFGMDDMKDALVESQTTGFLVSAEYNRGLRNWLHGKRTGLSPKRLGGLADKIAQAKGLSEPVPLDVAVQHTRDWWSALAAVPQGATGNDVIRALRVGRRPQGLLDGVRALEDWEIPEALQMRQFIDQVFNEGDAGLFNRSGLQTRDVLTEMGRYRAFKQGGEFEKMRPAYGEALDSQAHIWRDFDVTAVNPLDLLDQYMAAMAAAGVKPSTGAQISKLWGRYNPSAEEIKQLGLRRLNTTGNKADLATYVDPNAYFTAHEVRQMSFLQQALNYSKEFPAIMQPVVRAYDALTRVLKSSATVWRPGHHVTNILGDMFMNLLAGVNPLHIIRAVKMMQTWGHLLDADLGPLASLERATRPIGSNVDLAPNAKFGKDFVIVHVNGKPQPLSLAEAMQYAHRSGVAMTHAAVMDMAETGPGRVVSSTNPLARLNRATIGKADHALGEFSALRDNLTRLPHFIAALERGNFRSMDEAMFKAAGEVHDYHPTALAGSGFEQKVLRRTFYFYTWTRQAASRIIRTAMDRPGLITIPSKFQYEMAQANGLNPESIGVPFDPNNDNIPDYHTESLLGPTYYGGLTPVPDPEGKTAWGYSLSSPQIDALQSLFSGANSVPGQTGLEGTGQQVVGGSWDLAAQNANPLLKLPGVLTAGFDPGKVDLAEPEPFKNAQVDKTKWVADQLGILTTGAKLTGAYQQAFPGPIDPKTGQPYKTADQQDADRQRALWNALTGLKSTSYDDATSTAVAASQQKARALAAKRAH